MLDEIDEFLDFVDYVDHACELLESEEIFLNRPSVPRRYVRDAENPIQIYSDDDFFERYRFSKETVLVVILPLINNDLEKYDRRGLPLSPLMQLLIALHYYATSNFQIVCGDVHRVSQSTVCRIICKVSGLLAKKREHYVRLPSTPAEVMDVQNRFHAIAGFPEVIACIGGTHIPIANPGGPEAESYRNNKGQFSMNVQVAIGPDQQIMDIVAGEPGSTRDNRLFEHSPLRVRVEEGQLPGLLLGDGSYTCRPYLFTPVLHPASLEEQRYNESLAATRQVVDDALLEWRRRFPCLRRNLANKLPNIVSIVYATSVLHNIGRREAERLPPEGAAPPEQEVAAEPSGYGRANRLGLVVRDNFIKTHFTILPTEINTY